MTSGSQSGWANGSPYRAPSRRISSRAGTPRSDMSTKSRKNRSNPAGEMTSIMRAGVEPAFHMAWTSLRGLMM